MKITVIGGGSTYTPELINGFLQRASNLHLDELWLMDTNPMRLEIVGGFARRMAAAHDGPFKIVLSQDQRQSIAGASYVITQMRVGMMPARVADEYLGRRHGLIGQETTGVGGMAKALRTIPVLLKVARDIRETAPGALLVNFANPSGINTEALQRYAPEVASVGVCNAALTTKMAILERMIDLPGMGGASFPSLAPDRAFLDTLGLNHLTWYRGFTIDGQDVWSHVLQGYIQQLRSEKDPEWDVHTMETLLLIPNSYLQYFYYTGNKLAAQEKWPPSRGEQVMTIEADLLREYQEPGRTEPPANLMLRGGAYYSTVATQLINAHANNLGEIHVANTRQNGAVPTWPADWVLEMPCRVDAEGVHPISVEPLPPVCFGLLAQVKMYELLTVEAAVHGDRRAAYEALLANPLGPAGDRVQAVLEDILKTNIDYLPQFK
jgi:6-phospho-beta-glucosidase